MRRRGARPDIVRQMFSARGQSQGGSMPSILSWRAAAGDNTQEDRIARCVMGTRKGQHVAMGGPDTVAKMVAVLVDAVDARACAASYGKFGATRIESGSFGGLPLAFFNTGTWTL